MFIIIKKTIVSFFQGQHFNQKLYTNFEICYRKSAKAEQILLFFNF